MIKCLEIVEDLFEYKISHKQGVDRFGRSWIQSINYHPLAHKADIKTASNNIYRINDISPELYRAWEQSGDLGLFFNTHINKTLHKQ